MKKQFLALLIAFVILCCLPVAVYAHPVVDVEKDDCFVDIVLQDSKTFKGITDAEISCVRVAYAHSDDGNFNFYHLGTDKIIENIDSANTADELYQDMTKYPDKFEVHAVDKVAENGTYHFESLKTGLYLIIQKKAAEGYGDIHSFLVSVPYLRNGEYIYSVTANVKTELYNAADKIPETSNPEEPEEPEEHEEPEEPEEPEKETSKPDVKLPQTGQLYWPVPLLAAIGLALIIIGYSIRRKKTSK